MKQAIISAFLGRLRDRFCEYQEPLGILGKLELMARIPGVAGAEVVYPYEVDPPEIMLGHLRRCNLEVSAVNVNSKADPLCVNGSLSSPDPRVRRKAVELIKGAKDYAKAVVANARTLAATLKSEGLDIVSGGTDNHLMLVDLRPKNATGKRAEAALGRAAITCNKNGIPFDPAPFTITSGIRLGTPAGTTRGFGVAEFREVGALIIEVLDGLAKHGEAGNAKVEAAVKRKVLALTKRFPIY